MVKLEHYWSTNKNWWHWTEDGEIVMNEAAPNDAKESYRIYKQQLADIDRRTGRWLVIPKDKTGWNIMNSMIWIGARQKKVHIQMLI